MHLRSIRPEDRRRSGGSGAGPGFGPDWADTEPACFRSEAFAEDLHPDEGSGVQAVKPRRFKPTRLLRRGHGWVPVFGLALAAAFGLGASG
ncbi:MAG: hypothetical protein U5L05_05195 [Rubrivivax sp.]|nr:hypothetical protein [Rubrivivax sp.]